MASEAQKYKSHVDDVVSKLTPEETEAYIDTNYDTIDSLIRQFPNQQQQSLLVLGYSVVESRLLAVAKNILKHSDVELTLKDLSGDSPFQKSRKCVTKIGKLIVNDKLWTEVDSYRLVRNSIVHNAGLFLEDPPPLVQQLLKASTHIKISNHGEILLEEGFLVHFLVAAEALYEDLFTAWGGGSAA